MAVDPRVAIPPGGGGRTATCRSAILTALLAVVLIPFISSPTWGIDPHRALTQAFLRKWQFQQGLPQATIFVIRQTSDRRIWLGTHSGLYRFDGIRFVAAPDAGGISLKNLWIEDLCEDRSHNLWIATHDSGLVRMRDGSAARFGLAEGLPSLHVQCLLIDRNGNLWVGTDAGLARWADGKFVVYRTADGLANNDVWALCEARDGTIWIGGEGDRISIWNGSTIASRSVPLIAPRGSVRALLGAADGSVWVGTTAGLYQMNVDDVRRLGRADGLADDVIECLTESRDGALWVGTRDGVSRVQEKEIETFRTRDGLSQSTVFTLCEDHEGGVWIGTKHGLNQFVDRRALPLTASEGLPTNDTGPILQDKAGTVWIGTLGGGLARYDGRRCVPVLTAREGLPSDTILSLAEGSSGDLWIGTEHGLCRTRAGRIEETFTVAQGLPSNVVTFLLVDSRGVLWAGTDSGLAELDAGKFVVPEGSPDESHLPVLAVAEYASETLVVSTKGGKLLECKGRKLRPFPAIVESQDDTNAFYIDGEGRLWLGSQGGGLGLLDEGRIKMFTIGDGLYDDEVLGIVSEVEGRLGLACSRGIFFVSRAELLDFVAGKIKRITSVPYSPTEAFRTNESQSGVQPVVWKMRNGSIWFSTIYGVIIVDPAHMRRILPEPAVIVEESQINGMDVNPEHIPELPPGHANLYFRYTALSYASPVRITFRYKLEGFDRDWIEAGSRREAFYTNLPPGSYTFRVKAANLDGPWSEAAHPVQFTLPPHFYQSGWFVPLVLVFMGVAGWGASRLRVMQVKARMNAVLAERSRIARELHDTLIQGFSGVTMQMQALAARLHVSPERIMLNEIIHDAGDCLSEARRSVGGLRAAQPHAPANTTGLAGAVAQAAQQLTETRDVRLVLRTGQVPARLPADVEYNVLRIAQEAISNAVKHSGAGTIEVTLTSSADHLNLKVHDDGVGFAADGLPQPGHYGLIGMRERASQIHARLHFESSAAHGTTVQLDLLLGEAANRATVARAQGVSSGNGPM